VASTIRDADQFRALSEAELPPDVHRRIDKYLNQYTHWASSLKCEELLKYLNYDILGSLLLERMGVKPLTVSELDSRRCQTISDGCRNRTKRTLPDAKTKFDAWQLVRRDVPRSSAAPEL
jgi:hypothetical protein